MASSYAQTGESAGYAHTVCSAGATDAADTGISRATRPVMCSLDDGCCHGNNFLSRARAILFRPPRARGRLSPRAASCEPCARRPEAALHRRPPEGGKGKTHDDPIAPSEKFPSLYSTRVRTLQHRTVAMISEICTHPRYTAPVTVAEPNTSDLVKLPTTPTSLQLLGARLLGARFARVASPQVHRASRAP